jgi:hypothetical protein
VDSSHTSKNQNTKVKNSNKQRTKNKKQKTKNKEQGTKNKKTKNKKQKTRNKEQRTKNKEQRTKNKEQRTMSPEQISEVSYKFSSHLFWDIDRTKLQLEEHSHFFIGRVLQYGFLEDWKLLVQVYGLERIKETLLEIRFLDDISLHFASNFFSVPLEKFRCFSTKQSAQNYWNY